MQHTFEEGLETDTGFCHFGLLNYRSLVIAIAIRIALVRSMFSTAEYGLMPSYGNTGMSECYLTSGVHQLSAVCVLISFMHQWL